jgi:hypothetical protein
MGREPRDNEGFGSRVRQGCRHPSGPGRALRNERDEWELLGESLSSQNPRESASREIAEAWPAGRAERIF